MYIFTIKQKTIMATKRKTKTKAEKQAKKMKFVQKQNHQKNVIKGYQQAQQEKFEEYKRNIMSARNIMNLYNEKPEIASVVDGVIGLNEETVLVNEEGIVCWKESGEPLVEENKEFMPAEFYNIVLKQIDDNKDKNHVIDDLLVEDENGNMTLKNDVTPNILSSISTNSDGSSAEVVE